MAADGPEISSALFALAKGAHDVGVGVLVGSNGFNLAAMIGVSALVTGRVRLARETLLFEGTVGLIITLLASALLLRWLSPGGPAISSAVVAVPYLTVVVAGPRFRGHYLSRLSRALHEHAATDRPPDPSSEPDPPPVGLIVVDLVVIVAGSAGMVESALSLAGDWHISNAVLGFLILGPLTSIPNALTAVRLGLADRGAALVGETFNSNTINLGFGVIVPSLFVTFTAASTLGKLQLAWLIVRRWSQSPRSRGPAEWTERAARCSSACISPWWRLRSWAHERAEGGTRFAHGGSHGSASGGPGIGGAG